MGDVIEERREGEDVSSRLFPFNFRSRRVVLLATSSPLEEKNSWGAKIHWAGLNLESSQRRELDETRTDSRRVFLQ